MSRIPYPESKKNYWTEKYIDNFDLLKQKSITNAKLKNKN